MTDKRLKLEPGGGRRGREGRQELEDERDCRCAGREGVHQFRLNSDKERRHVTRMTL